MDIPLRSAYGAGRRVNNRLTRGRLIAYGLTMCVLYVVFLAMWARVTHGFQAAGAARPAGDFAVFWSASHVLLHGTAAQVYNFNAFAAAEMALFGSVSKDTFMPWLYPPTFLLLVSPFALLPFLLSYAIFIGTSLYAYVKGALAVSGLARWTDSPRIAVFLVATSPCVFVAALFGQNSLLTAALAVFAVRWIDRFPVRAGICIGLLCIKPQLAMVFPFVLFATRSWRALASAAVTGATFAALSVALFGTHTLKLSLLAADLARGVILEQSAPFWLASPTSFAALRLGGVPLSAAYLIQGAIALLAIVSACHIWRKTHDAGTRIAILALATLIANPYVWHYELAWLGFTLAWLLATGLRDGWLRWEQPVIVLAWLLPVFELFNRYVVLPQIGPIVLLIVLLTVLRRTREADASWA